MTASTARESIPFALLLEVCAAVDLDLELEGLDDLAFEVDAFDRDAPDDLDVVFFFDAELRDEELLAAFGDEDLDLEPEAARDFDAELRDEELLAALGDEVFDFEPEAARDFDPAVFDELDLVERDFDDEAREAGFFEPAFDELDLLVDFLATGISFPPFSWNQLNASTAIEIPRPRVGFSNADDFFRFDSVHFGFSRWLNVQ